VFAGFQWLSAVSSRCSTCAELIGFGRVSTVRGLDCAAASMGLDRLSGTGAAAIVVPAAPQMVRRESSLTSVR
jgi:hypothetical protein